MQAQTTYHGTPTDIEQSMAKVIEPLLIQMADLQAKVRQRRTIMTVAQVAEDAGRSAQTVREWIVAGRVPPGKTKAVKLKIVDGLSDGAWLIHWDDYMEFLAHFPRIQITTKQ